MTSSERRASTIAKRLLHAIEAIESFNDDPEIILDDLDIISLYSSSGVKDAIAALRKHYLVEGV